MTDIRELADIEQIEQLKARCCLFLDAQEWDGLLGLFTAEARFSVGSGDYSSPQAFVENLRVTLAGESHVHTSHMPIIEVTGADSARGRGASPTVGPSATTRTSTPGPAKAGAAPR